MKFSNVAEKFFETQLSLRPVAQYKHGPLAVVFRLNSLNIQKRSEDLASDHKINQQASPPSVPMMSEDLQHLPLNITKH